MRKNRIEDSYRYERKFYTNALFRDEVLQIIHLHPANFRLAFPDRCINNIYLDTICFSSFNDNVDGLAKRLKYRVRWYGGLEGDVEKPYLEVKIRNNAVGSKELYALPSFALHKGFASSDLQKVFQNAKLPPIHQAALAGCRSVLLNGYRRRYFESFDKLFRVTVDDKMLSRSIRRFDNRLLGVWSDTDSTVVEMKYAIENENSADHMAEFLKLRMTKNSKYVTGIFDIYG